MRIREKKIPSRLATHAYVGNPINTLHFYIAHARVMTAANYAEARHAKLVNRILTISLLIFSFLITVLPATHVLAGSGNWLSSIVTILGALTVSFAAVNTRLILMTKPRLIRLPLPNFRASEEKWKFLHSTLRAILNPLDGNWNSI
jgi:hypothetical protein